MILAWASPFKYKNAFVPAICMTNINLWPVLCHEEAYK